jgi:thiol-disulfide isomerase/thioredoxin
MSKIISANTIPYKLKKITSHGKQDSMYQYHCITKFPVSVEYSSNKIHLLLRKGGDIKALTNMSQGSVQVEDLGSSPSSVDLEPITSEYQFDQVIARAQQLQESVVIVWMATWCRKCIYLKPKLEKLAADYFPRVRFYCIDVNNVPHKLVVRAGVTKMPTIQVWKDCKKQSEVIGGHKAYLVVNEIREMIENEQPL